MPSIIQEKIAAGTLKLFHAYKAGTAYDFSGNGNHGVYNSAANPPEYGERQIMFNNSAARVTAAYDASLQFTSGSLVLHGDFNKIRANNALIVSRDGGEYAYQFFTTASTIRLRNAGTDSLLAAAYTGSRYVAVSHTNGTAPEFFFDGVSVGNGSQNLTLTAATTAPTEIGGSNVLTTPLGAPLEYALVFTTPLTASEHARLYSELESLRWPSRPTAQVKRKLIVPVSATGLVSGYNFNNVDDTLVNQVAGAGDGTIAGPVYEESILDSGQCFGQNGGIQTTFNSKIDVITHAFTMRRNTTAVTNQGIFGSSNLFGPCLRVSNTGTLTWYPQFGAAGTVLAETLPADQILRIVFSWNNTTGAISYWINGVAFTDTSAVAYTAGAFNLWIGQHNSGAINDFDGCFYGDFETYNTLPSQAWVDADYARAKDAVQFHTGFGSIETITDISGTDDQFITNSPFQVGTTGEWSISTELVNGVPTKILECETAGFAYINMSGFRHLTPTDAAYGSWRFWINKADGSTTDIYIISDAMTTGAENGYLIRIADTEALRFRRATAGAQTSISGTAAATATAGTWEQYDVTRRYDGVFTLYLNKTAWTATTGTNPVTDTNHTTSDYMLLNFDAGDKIALGGLNNQNAIFKYLGVVTP